MSRGISTVSSSTDLEVSDPLDEKRCALCGIETRLGCPDCEAVFYCSQQHFQLDYSSHVQECIPKIGVRAPGRPVKKRLRFGDREADALGKYFAFSVVETDKNNMGEWMDRLLGSFTTICGEGFLEVENLKLTLEYARNNHPYWTLLVMSRAPISSRDRNALNDIAGFVLIQWPNNDGRKSAEIAYICARQFKLGTSKPFRVGRLLHLWAWIHMKEQGATAVYLEATEDNEKTVYQPLGYETSKMAYDKKIPWHHRFHFLEVPALWGPLMRQRLGKSNFTAMRRNGRGQTLFALSQFQIAEQTNQLGLLWEPLVSS